MSEKENKTKQKQLGPMDRETSMTEVNKTGNGQVKDFAI
jgi:hypothetical protein